jgi:hypothetical protein
MRRRVAERRVGRGRHGDEAATADGGEVLRSCVTVD